MAGEGGAGGDLLGVSHMPPDSAPIRETRKHAFRHANKRGHARHRRRTPPTHWLIGWTGGRVGLGPVDSSERLLLPGRRAARQVSRPGGFRPVPCVASGAAPGREVSLSLSGTTQLHAWRCRVR